jgi:hypothetical protein
MMRNFIVCILAIFVIGFGQYAYALQKQNAAAPGTVLDSATEQTTSVLMKGVFAIEVTSTGVGTLSIYRSEANSAAVTGTDWVKVKTITNASAGDKRIYMYESFGDAFGDASPGAWYVVYLTTLTSGSYRVRLVR